MIQKRKELTSQFAFKMFAIFMYISSRFSFLSPKILMRFCLRTNVSINLAFFLINKYKCFLSNLMQFTYLKRNLVLEFMYVYSPKIQMYSKNYRYNQFIFNESKGILLLYLLEKYNEERELCSLNYWGYICLQYIL